MKEQRRLAAVVSADIVGYARLMGQDESGTLEAVKALRREVIDPAIASHGGRIVKTTGDGMLLEFASVVDAMRCVLGVQSEVAKRNATVPEDRRIVFRVGVNLGDIIMEGDDIFGDGVNVAARLESIAAPGGVAVSNRVYEDVRDRLDEHFVDGGEQALKNIARPVRVYHWTPSAGTDRIRKPMPTAKPASRWSWALAAASLLIVLAGTGWWLLSPHAVVQPPAQAVSRVGADAAQRTPVRATIAVLPFVNQSGDAAQDYFGEGITEDLIAALGRFADLAVVAARATSSYRGKTVRSNDIGRELGVRYIVEGTIRRAGSRVRVRAQLSDAATGNLLWSQQYDEEIKDVFALQDSITRQVAGALAVSLGRIEQQRAVAKPTENLDAYDLVLRGRDKMRLATRAGNREARALFERATQLDPRYADAHAALGRAFGEVATVGWTEDPGEAAERAFEHARKTLVLDPDNCTAISVMAWVHTVRGQYELALAASDRALAINPSHAESMLERAGVLLWLGRIAEAVAAGEMALRFDPHPRAGQTFSIAMAFYQAKRHNDAVQLLEHSVLRFPSYPFFHALLAASYGQMDRRPEAAQELDKFRRLNPFFDPSTAGSRFQNPEHQAYFIEGLVKAGLK